MFINIRTCFDHNFGHHQALNEHSQVINCYQIRIRIVSNVFDYLRVFI
jgi:hypothetical protein